MKNKHIVGDKGLTYRTELPVNMVGVHKVIAWIVAISIILTFILLAIFIRKSQENSFQRFINRHKAGVYQGITLAPLADCRRCHKADKNHDVKDGWLIVEGGKNGEKRN